MCGHGLQLRTHSCSVRLMNTTVFQLLRTQGHVFTYRIQIYECKQSSAFG
jgi:hypothetical protein